MPYIDNRSDTGHTFILMKQTVIPLMLILAWGCRTVPPAVFPPTSDDKYAVAFELMSRGNYEQAREHLDLIIEEDPGYSKAYIARALIKEIRLEYDEALADLNNALRLEEGLYIAYFNKANLYIRRGEYSRAIVNYTLCLELEPGYAPAYLNRGITYLRELREEDALADFRQYRILNTNNNHNIDEVIRKLESRRT